MNLRPAAFLLSLMLSLVSVRANPDFPPFSHSEYEPAGLGPREPELQVDFPGGAASRSLATGSAVIAVLVDADGKAIDFQTMGYTDKAFATILLERAHALSYKPARLKGTAIPACYNLGYHFASQNVSMTAMDAARERFNNSSSTLTYSPVGESKLDHPLEFTHYALPRVPANYPVTDAKAAKVVVSFYVDEQGEVHVPNVESAPSPALVFGAIKAVRRWAFKPPTVAGKPVLVYTGREVDFMPRTPVEPSAEK
jgi:TonB family protein